MHKYKLLIVDDDKMNLMLATRMLGETYEVKGVLSGKDALSWVATQEVDLILLDIHMPEMDGFEVLAQLKEIPEKANIPVIFLSADSDCDVEVKGIEMGAFDFIRKPFVPTLAKLRIERCLEEIHSHMRMEEEVAKKTAELAFRQSQVEAMSEEITKTLASTIDAKDTYTQGHSSRVADYSVILAKELGWSERELYNLRYMALLHDIGKIGIPDQVLNKPGRLTSAEFDIIKSHTVTGADILKRVKTLDGAKIVARHHHERYDGLGYPDGLKGTDIPLAARIAGIADAFDAMSSDRVYRKALSSEIIRAELIKGRGTQFDPDLLDVFLKLYDEGKLNIGIQKVSSETNEMQEEVIALAKKIYDHNAHAEHKNTFADICDYMKELQAKYNNKFTVMVISFDMEGEKEHLTEELSRAMQAMEYGIINTIKAGDICNRIGEERFMIVLLESKSQDAGTLIDRILASFYRNNFSSEIKPIYKIADIGADKQVGTKKKIMVVDDNSMNLRITECALERFYEVVKANSGSVALDVLPDSGVEFILLDVIMPEMGGFETYEKIRELDGFKDIPICFLTADKDEESIEKMKELNAPHVQKPFDTKELILLIESMIR